MDAIPVPRHPSLEQYKKLAKELKQAIGAGTVRAWASRWPDADAAIMERVARSLTRGEKTSPAGGGQTSPAGGEETSLTRAQLVLARSHGFESWPKFAKHIEQLENARVADGAVVRFETAADAVVDGDLATLRRLLARDRSLIRATSSRRHHSTLLHYVSANGIEDFRQRTPKNIVDVTQLLLDAGAEVDAANDDYGGRGTTLGLVATSAHPRLAGVQIDLLELLVSAGANIDGLDGGWSPIDAALANGCPEAAEWLANHGARLSIISAAGTGRLDRLEELVSHASPRDREQALRIASLWGRTRAVELLLDHGVDIAAGEGQTALHLAVVGGHLDTVQLLLSRGAPLEIENRYGGTVLGQALWSAAHEPRPDHPAIIAALRAAGARDPDRDRDRDR
jgi:hypothetical protein